MGQKCASEARQIGYTVNWYKRMRDMRTRLSICLKKERYSSELEAAAAARRASLRLRVYRCDRCRKFHLTSRTKGKRIPRPDGEIVRAHDSNPALAEAPNDSRPR